MVVAPVYTHEPEEVILLNGPCAKRLLDGYSASYDSLRKDTQATLRCVEGLARFEGVKQWQAVVMKSTEQRRRC